MDLTYSEILRRNLRLSAPDACSLVVAAIDALGPSGLDRELPDPDLIRLRRTGHVSLAGVGSTAGEHDLVRQRARLLGELLALDHDGGEAGRVPGRLLVLIARATGRIDAAPPSASELVARLREVGSPEPAPLAMIYRRCAGLPVNHAAEEAAPVELDDLPLHPVAVVEDDVGAPTRRGARGFIGSAAAVLGGVAAGFVFATRFFDAMAISDPSLWKIRLPDVTVSRSAPAPGDRAAPAPTSDEPTSAADLNASREPVRSQGPSVEAMPLLRADRVGMDVFSPSFAPDGRGLFFHAGRERAALMRASLGHRGAIDVETVLQDGAANYHAVPSPDGSWMAYDSDRDGERGVYIARADGREPRKISGTGYAAVPSWASDGRRIAFVRAEPDRPRVWNVWLADVDTGALTRVSRHRVGQAWRVSWFPGSDRIAYSVEQTLVITDLTDGSSRVYPSPVRGRLLRTPAVSPDGRWVVFQVHRDGVWVLDVRRNRARRLFRDVSAEEFSWSPDGRHVVYHTRRGGGWSVWRLSFPPP